MIKRIYDVLKQNNISCYFPEQHKGECREKYVVVKKGGVAPVFGTSSERPIYTVMCFVPQNNYSQLETYMDEVKEAMRKMYPLVKYVGNETPPFYEQETKSHMVSFDYAGMRKIKLS